MTKKPFISVILPIKNSSKYLDKCLESISNQSFSDFEVLAFDDLSTDNSYQILKDFTKKDKRFRAFKNKKHYGMAVCFNRGIKRAKGSFVTFLNAKDVLSRNRFKAQIKFLTENSKIVAVGTQSSYVTTANRKINESSFPVDHEAICKSLLRGKPMQFETALINRLLLPKDLLKFKSTPKPILLQELFMKLTNYGELANIPQVLHKRIDQTTQSNIKNIPNFVKLFVKTAALDEFPSIRTFLPDLRQT